MRIVSAVHKEIVAAFFAAEPRVVETDGRIETRLPVAVHIVGTGSSDFVVVVLPFPVIAPNFICSGKSAFHISGGRVGDRKSILHKEGIHEGLGHSPASVTSAHNRCAVLFIVTIITTSRTGEQNFLVTLVCPCKHCVLDRCERIDTAIGILHLIQFVSSCLCCVYEFLAGLFCPGPAGRVVTCAEKLLA